MVIQRDEKLRVERLIKAALEQKSLEELLEDFDISPEDVIYFLFESGQLDPEILENEVLT